MSCFNNCINFTIYLFQTLYFQSKVMISYIHYFLCSQSDLNTLVLNSIPPLRLRLLLKKIKGIPVEEIIVDISDEDKLCPQCGTGLELIGKETIRHEIEYIPAQVKVKNMLVYTMVVMNAKKKKNHIS